MSEFICASLGRCFACLTRVEHKVQRSGWLLDAARLALSVVGLSSVNDIVPLPNLDLVWFDVASKFEYNDIGFIPLG